MLKYAFGPELAWPVTQIALSLALLTTVAVLLARRKPEPTETVATWIYLGGWGVLFAFHPSDNGWLTFGFAWLWFLVLVAEHGAAKLMLRATHRDDEPRPSDRST